MKNRIDVTYAFGSRKFKMEASVADFLFCRFFFHQPFISLYVMFNSLLHNTKTKLIIVINKNEKKINKDVIDN